MIKDITGIILAGGKNSRMGEDKSFVTFSGKPLIEILIDKLSPIFEDLIIVTNKPRLYKKYRIGIQTDSVKDCGPLGGIYTGLLRSSTMYNFIVACDMPFLNQDLIKFMSEEAEDYDAVIPMHNGLLEPLCAVYSKVCIRPIADELYRHNLKITGFLRYVKARIIEEGEILKFDPAGRSFININTPEDQKSVSKLSFDT